MKLTSDRHFTRWTDSHTSGLPRTALITWGRAGSSVLGVCLVTGAWLGCGGSSEDEGDGVPGFGGVAPGGATVGPMLPSSPTSSGNPTPTCTPGSANCPPSSTETMNPNTPIDQPSNTPVASAGCTPNTATCVGSSLNRCDAAGAALPPLDCAATPGGTCGQQAGVAACLAPTCTPGAVTCDSANAIATCAADGSGATFTRCADGTNCTGAGQCAPVACNAQELTQFNGGEATVYWFGQGTVNFGDIACGYGIQPGNLGNGDGDAVTGIVNPTLFAAMNTQNYDTAGACGACVEMNYQGRSVTVTVVDECPIGSNPTCTAGHIDLSRAAWNQLTNNAAGTQIFGVNWRMVSCNTDDNVSFQLKEATNEYWNQFLVRNHRYPIARAEVEMEPGRWVEARRENYNYWLPTEGNGGEGGDMGTYRVRITDVNGGVIEQQLELRGGQQVGEGQFACQ